MISSGMSETKFESDLARANPGQVPVRLPAVSWLGMLRRLLFGRSEATMLVEDSGEKMRGCEVDQACSASHGAEVSDATAVAVRMDGNPTSELPDNLVQSLRAPENEPGRQQLDRALASLRADQLQLVRWRMFQFVTYREIATRLKCGELAARQRCEAALGAFRNAYQAEVGQQQATDGQKSN